MREEKEVPMCAVDESGKLVIKMVDEGLYRRESYSLYGGLLPFARNADRIGWCVNQINKLEGYLANLKAEKNYLASNLLKVVPIEELKQMLEELAD